MRVFSSSGGIYHSGMSVAGIIGKSRYICAKKNKVKDFDRITGCLIIINNNHNC